MLETFLTHLPHSPSTNFLQSRYKEALVTKHKEGDLDITHGTGQPTGVNSSWGIYFLFA